MGDNVIDREKTGPLPTVDANGVATAPTSVKTNPKTHTTIHLHPAGLFVKDGTPYPFDALTPTPYDKSTFASVGTNIIVGRLEKGTDKNISPARDGSFNDSRPVGAAIYRGSNTSSPAMILKKQVIINILNRNGK